LEGFDWLFQFAQEDASLFISWYCYRLADQKLVELARRIDEVNPKQKEEIRTKGSDVFEI
jgi:hypothetical protein